MLDPMWREAGGKAALGGQKQAAISLEDPACVGPAVRRGVAELDGRGDAVGGIVIMRFGENALQTIRNVKAKIAALTPSLPAGVFKPFLGRAEQENGNTFGKDKDRREIDL